MAFQAEGNNLGKGLPGLGLSSTATHHSTTSIPSTLCPQVGFIDYIAHPLWEARGLTWYTQMHRTCWTLWRTTARVVPEQDPTQP